MISNKYVQYWQWHTKKENVTDKEKNVTNYNKRYVIIFNVCLDIYKKKWQYVRHWFALIIIERKNEGFYIHLKMLNNVFI